MTPEDIGGKEILNKIKNDTEALFERATRLTMGHLCYCQRPLSRRLFNRPFPEWRCTSCFANQSGRITFRCPDDSCLFKRVSGTVYRICALCHDYTVNRNISRQTEEKENETDDTFFYRQLERSINMIS